MRSPHSQLNDVEGTEQALLQAVQKRRAARRTMKDIWIERALGAGSIVFLVLFVIGMLRSV